MCYQCIRKDPECVPFRGSTALNLLKICLGGSSEWKKENLKNRTPPNQSGKTKLTNGPLSLGLPIIVLLSTPPTCPPGLALFPFSSLWAEADRAFAVWNTASHHRSGNHSPTLKASAWKMTHINFTHGLLTKASHVAEPEFWEWGCRMLPQEVAPNVDGQ